MASIFTQIINGDIPCYKIAEDDQNIAFLDINPLQEGHTLVVPKLEVDRLFDLPAENYRALMAFAQNVAKAIEQTIPCNRVGMAVVGLEVPHAHVHLIPIKKMADMDFMGPKLKLSRERMQEIAHQISKNTNAIILQE